MNLAKHERNMTAEPVRVLHILEATGGGTMRYMENIAEATLGLNFLCGFAYGISRADSSLLPFLDRVKKRGWQTFMIEMGREIKPASDAKALLQLRRAIKSFSPDILHCHSSKAGALGRAASSTTLKRPIRLYSPHAVSASLGSTYLRIEKQLARFTDRFVAVSESERRQIMDLTLAINKPVDVIYPSIDFEHFQPASQEEARALLGFDSSPRVIAVGRLIAQKDPEAFIQIMKRVRSIRPDVLGVWVGSGELGDEFHASVVANGLQDVISVVPWVHDVRAYLAAADVLLSTARFESFGYVTAEAYAMQRPVVASNVTGTCDIMRKELAQWLFEPSDYSRAAQLIIELINDPATAARIANQGRDTMMRCFTTENMRESLMNAYASALKPARQRAFSSSSKMGAVSAVLIPTKRPRDDAAT
jgi:glycosyltransferase involved in cell wall biosynthesis